MPANAAAAPQRRRPLVVTAATAILCAGCAAGDRGGAAGVFDIHLPQPSVGPQWRRRTRRSTPTSHSIRRHPSA